MAEMSGEVSVNNPVGLNLLSGETVIIKVLDVDGNVKSTVMELTVPNGKHFDGTASVHGLLKNN